MSHAVHPRLRSLFATWESEQISWCLVRGEQFLADPPGDVDVLVAPDHRRRAERALVALGFVPVPRRPRSRHRNYVLSEGPKWLTVDLVTGLDYGAGAEVAAPLSTRLLSGARLVDGVRLPEPSDQFWTLVLHCLFDKGFVSPRRAEDLSGLLASVHRPSVGEALLVTCLGSPTAPEDALAAVAAGDWDSLVALGGLGGDGAGPARTGSVRHRVPAGKRPARLLAGSPVRHLARLGYVAIWHRAVLGRRWFTRVRPAVDRQQSGPSRRRPRPVVVSLSGLDGAGKTRQIDALVDYLGRTGRTVEVMWVPFRVWPETLINRLPAGLRSRLGPRRRSGAEQPAAGAARARRLVPAPWRLGPATLVWTAVATVASVSAGLSLRRRVTTTTPSVVILDRYRMDSIVKLQYWYHDAPPRLISWLVRKLAPAPDVEVFLHVEPEVAYARKPEQWSVPQLTRQARLYDALADTGSVVRLNAAMLPEVLSDQICRSVEAAARAR